MFLNFIKTASILLLFVVIINNANANPIALPSHKEPGIYMYFENLYIYINDSYATMDGTFKFIINNSSEVSQKLNQYYIYIPIYIPNNYKKNININAECILGIEKKGTIQFEKTSAPKEYLDLYAPSECIVDWYRVKITDCKDYFRVNNKNIISLWIKIKYIQPYYKKGDDAYLVYTPLLRAPSHALRDKGGFYRNFLVQVRTKKNRPPVEIVNSDDLKKVWSSPDNTTKSITPEHKQPIIIKIDNTF